MPSMGRLHIVGGYYHVMGRGLVRCRLVSGKTDKEDFISRLALLLKELPFECLA